MGWNPKVGGYLGKSLGYTTDALKKIGDSVWEHRNPKKGGLLGAQVDLAQQASQAEGVDTAKLAEKAGLGKYKPNEITFDDSSFKDMQRAEQYKGDLINQRTGAQGRTFEGALAAKLGDANQMQAAELGDANQMQAAQMSNEQAEFRQGQKDLVGALQKQAAGQGPSLAGLQLNEARDQQIATAMALGASQRGLTAGQGLRQIADQTQDANQFAAREAAKMRIAEQLSAQQQLQGALSGARSQDQSFAAQQAGFEQQAAMANQAASNQFALQQGSMDQQAAMANQDALNQFALQQGAMDQQVNLENMRGELAFQRQQDALIQSLNNQIGQAGMAQDQRLMDLERMKLAQALEMEKIKAGAYANHQQRTSNLISGIASGGAKAASMMTTGGAA